MTEHETRLKRILYRSWHRGCKETDVILGPYAEKASASFSPDELNLYEEFLEEFDSDIWNWLVEKDTGFDEKYRPLIESLRLFTQEQHVA